jgi:hypothetical protein
MNTATQTLPIQDNFIANPIRALTDGGYKRFSKADALDSTIPSDIPLPIVSKRIECEMSILQGHEPVIAISAVFNHSTKCHWLLDGSEFKVRSMLSAYFKQGGFQVFFHHETEPNFKPVVVPLVKAPEMTSLIPSFTGDRLHGTFFCQAMNICAQRLLATHTRNRHPAVEHELYYIVASPRFRDTLQSVQHFLDEDDEPTTQRRLPPAQA